GEVGRARICVGDRAETSLYRVADAHAAVDDRRGGRAEVHLRVATRRTCGRVSGVLVPLRGGGVLRIARTRGRTGVADLKRVALRNDVRGCGVERAGTAHIQRVVQARQGDVLPVVRVRDRDRALHGPIAVSARVVGDRDGVVGRAALAAS